MNLPFAANLFDNPWVVAAILIFGALANWLSSRQRNRQAEPPPEDEPPSPAAGRPTGELNLEETLRRLLGGEVQMPAPPVIPDTAPSARHPVPDASEADPHRTSRSLPLAMPPVDLSASAAALELDRMTRQFEDLKEQGRHPATVVAHRHGRRSQQAHRIALPWRNRRNARQALVASIVLAPPKGLEP